MPLDAAPFYLTSPNSPSPHHKERLMLWPNETQAELEAFYSKHRLGADGRPTAAWQEANLMRIVLPYPMVIAWPPGSAVTRMLCHKKVAESLKRVFTQILEHYGSVEKVKRARMHLFGGCYNYRIVRGASRLSTHAWGAGIDIDPDNNPLGKRYDPAAGMMPQPVIDIFKAEGWKWGGDFRSRPDCMHFQATQ
jgi:hypothetical protein